MEYFLFFLKNIFFFRCNKKSQATFHFLFKSGILSKSPFLSIMSPIVMIPFCTQALIFQEIILELYHNGVDIKDSIP